MFWHATAGLTVTFLGHAGDGNIHTTVIYRRDDPDEARRAHELSSAICAFALDLGGTVSGEHGIGILKRKSDGGSSAATATISRHVAPDRNVRSCQPSGRADRSTSCQRGRPPGSSNGIVGMGHRPVSPQVCDQGSGVGGANTPPEPPTPQSYGAVP